MKKITIILLLLMSQLGYTQDLSIRTSAGFAGYGSPVDGIYFSFDIGVPIIKGVQIAPSFTFTSNLDYNRIKYFWNDIHPQQYIINKDKDSGGKLAGIFELQLVVNPFKYFKNKNVSKIDFGIGAGYGLSFYAHNYYNYSSPNGNNDFVGVINNSGIRKSASVRMFYNYHFKKFFMGINLGVVDFIEGEGASILGLQFGVNI